MDFQRITTVYLYELDGNTLEWYALEVSIPIRAFNPAKTAGFCP
jgi:hypothetical protein